MLDSRGLDAIDQNLSNLPSFAPIFASNPFNQKELQMPPPSTLASTSDVALEGENDRETTISESLTANLDNQALNLPSALKGVGRKRAVLDLLETSYKNMPAPWD